MHSRPGTRAPVSRAALSHHRLCARANLLLGDLELGLGNVDAAIDAWKRIESQNPAYPRARRGRVSVGAYKDLGRAEEGLNLLRGYLENIRLSTR